MALRNYKRTFVTYKFRSKSSFDPKNKDAIIEIYLSSLEERLLDMIFLPKHIIISLRKTVMIYITWRCDPFTITKGADKSSVLGIVWKREDYLRETCKLLDDTKIYKGVPNNSNVIVNTIMYAMEKIRLRGDLFSETFNYYFFAEDPEFSGFCGLNKIHKRLQNILGRLRLLHWKNILIFELPSRTTCSES